MATVPTRTCAAFSKPLFKMGGEEIMVGSRTWQCPKNTVESCSNRTALGAEHNRVSFDYGR